jgi:hypothetical protein
MGNGGTLMIGRWRTEELGITCFTVIEYHVKLSGIESGSQR